MTETAHACMRTRLGDPIPLRSSRADIHINDIISSVTLEQAYENRENAPIEAVYTFPVPVDAALHRLEVALGEQTFTAIAVERQQAEARYEQALDQRDAAVMLENPQPGLYTLNFANLPAGEKATIRVVYAVPHQWVGDRLRVCVPTVIALRYGSQSLPPHSAPPTQFSAEIDFSFSITVSGAIADTPFECPTHALVRRPAEAGMVLGLQKARAFLDRDLVLTFTRTTAQDQAVALVDVLPDGDDAHASSTAAASVPTARARQVATIMFTPRCCAPADTSPRCVKLLIDCSGSMAGESIAQARNAVGAVLSQLREDDYFAILRFGTTVQSLPNSAPIRATHKHLIKARRAVRAIDADLGGTELDQALRAAWQMTGPATHREEILLVTDGAFGPWQSLVDEARKHAQGLFTVGVGSAPAEATLRSLAAAGNGGRAEFATPGEQMCDVIVRQFERIRLPRVRSMAVQWPRAPLSTAGIEGAVMHAGDTHAVHGWFADDDSPTPLTGDVTVDVHWEHGEHSSHRAPVQAASAFLEPGILGALAARERMRESEDKDEILALALRHHLPSEITNLLLTTALQQGQGTEMPRLRQVPQMHAEGHLGLGSKQIEDLLNQTFGDPLPARARSGVRGVPEYAGGPRLARPRRAFSPAAAGDSTFLHRSPDSSSAPSRFFSCKDVLGTVRALTERYPDWLGDEQHATRSPGGTGTVNDKARMREIMKALGVHKPVQRGLLALLDTAQFSARELVSALIRLILRESGEESGQPTGGGGESEKVVRAVTSLTAV